LCFMKFQRHFLLIPIAGIVVFYLFWMFRSAPWNAMRWTGAILMVASFILFSIAHVQLGSSFSVSAQARNLVTTGLYSRIRNPIYLFGGLLIVGVLLFLDQPRYLLIFLILIPLQLVRMRQEAKVLEEKFGDAYRKYKKSTWF
jgi:protein-S-isoprenylcysteine O-methyltransferase Ste14